MRVNPFYDSWLFLIGEDAFHLGIGPWRYLLVAIYWALAIASIYLAYRNWQADPAQRTKAHLGTWLARALIGTMWFEGCLWKLPIPSDGFKYWLEQEGKYAAWGFYQDFVTSVLLPGFTFMNIVAFLAEIGIDAGANASVLPAFGACVLVGFGAVVAALPTFGLVRDWVLSIGAVRWFRSRGNERACRAHGLGLGWPYDRARRLGRDLYAHCRPSWH